MKIRSKNIRMPEDALNNFKKKQTFLEKEYAELTGKHKRIPLTNIFRLASESGSVHFGEEDLLKLPKRRWKTNGK